MKNKTARFLRRMIRDLKRENAYFWQDERGLHCMYIKHSTNPNDYIPWEDAKRELGLLD